MVPKMWDKPVWEGVWPYLDPWDSVRLRTISMHCVPKKYGLHGELFFFLLKKEPIVLGELVELGPCISAETTKTCALIGLHMMAEEMPFGRTVTLLLIQETCGRMVAQKAPGGAATALNGQEVRVLLHWSVISTTSTTSLLKSLGRIGQVK